MPKRLDQNHGLFLLIVGLCSWLLPGAGYLLLHETKRAVIIFVVIVMTFCIGLYAGSVGVVDPIGAKPWYVAQVMVSPLVAALGNHTAGGGYPVYGRPNEIGHIYTCIAGLLNLLCIINAVYLAHLRRLERSGG